MSLFEEDFDARYKDLFGKAPWYERVRALYAYVSDHDGCADLLWPDALGELFDDFKSLIIGMAAQHEATHKVVAWTAQNRHRLVRVKSNSGDMSGRTGIVVFHDPASDEEEAVVVEVDGAGKLWCFSPDQLEVLSSPGVEEMSPIYVAFAILKEASEIDSDADEIDPVVDHCHYWGSFYGPASSVQLACVIAHRYLDRQGGDQRHLRTALTRIRLGLWS